MTGFLNLIKTWEKVTAWLVEFMTQETDVCSEIRNEIISTKLQQRGIPERGSLV